jgi:two-component system, NtrC family, sensor kinase
MSSKPQAYWKLKRPRWFWPFLVMGMVAFASGHLGATPLMNLIAKANGFLASNRDSAWFYADQAVKIAEFEENDTLIGIALLLRGQASMKLANYAAALEDFQRKQKMSANFADHFAEAEAWQWVGDAQAGLEKTDAAIDAYDEAFMHFKFVEQYPRMATCLLRKGQAQEKKKSPSAAREAYLEGLQIARKAGAASETGFCLEALGLFYLEQKEYELAQQHLRNALGQFEVLHNEQERAVTIKGLSNLYLAQKKYKSATEFAQEGLQIAREAGSRTLTMDFYQLLGDIMAGQGDFERATDYYKLNALIRDSLAGNVGARELSEVVLQYEKEKVLLEKEKIAQEVALQQAQLALNDAEMKRQSYRFYIILAGMGIFLVFGGFLAYAFIQKNKANRRLNLALTDLRNAQDQLVRSEKLASLGQVTAGIAHEIRNPLNFVNSLSKLSVGMIDELAEEMTELNGQPLEGGKAKLLLEYFDDIRSNTQKVLEHGERAGRIVRDMLQHSALESGDKTEFAVNELVDEYLKVAYHSQPARQEGGATFNCDLVFEPDAKAAKITAVRPEIGRALLNIMVNAFEAVQVRKEKGETDYQPKVAVRTEKTDKGVKIMIQDNGSGIAESDVQRVFDPFFTTKPPNRGTGLGLSLAHETIVRKHMGKISVKSSPAEGTLFEVFLPN